MNDSNPSGRVIIAIITAITIAVLIILSGGSLRRNYEHSNADMMQSVSTIPISESPQR